MSISSVMDRITSIQGQIEQLSTFATSTASDTSATEFGDELTSALGATTSARTATGTAATTDTADVSAQQQQVISAAESALGLPYVWGGNSLTTGVDCSGLVQQAYKTIGVDLPRLSADQARSGTAVASMADAKPGDLLAWDNSSRNNGADHIAIYLGDGTMIEAPHTGAKVRIVDVPSTPDYIRRIIGNDATSARTSTTASVASTIPTSVGKESVATARSAYDLQALFSGAS
ncbi:C40 family peptidase [Nocardioides sp. Kera G14]|uniref:C40 family peptidase n=1 Tax=Nocardioides sp. Kera G14 TaxID=2884264 RepID=UPI001D0FDD4A|nr:C40 family peptidase [Nocardioides sp. Kera G14]UDY24065.1 C40 family peptidase [Nocardioides sp. Kera G14]